MKNIFEVVTNQIVKQLNEGIVPWRRPWSTSGPKSYVSNKEYSGVNVFLLQSGYKSPYWITFKQCQKQGGSIRAGEHGSPIVFIDRFMKETTNKQGEKVLKPFTFLKYYTVFNWEQTKGLPEKVPPERNNQQITSAEDLLRKRGPNIKCNPEEAFYNPYDDSIYLPVIDQFESSEAFYSVAFHELTHWTGASGRCSRDTVKNYHVGKDVRSQEELTAEMGAAFLCQLAGLDTSETLPNSSAYIQSWIQHLQNNPRWVLKASKHAREAVEYIQTGQIPSKEGAGSAAAAA